LQTVVEQIARTPPTARSGQTFLGAVDQALLRHGESPVTASAIRHKLHGASWPEVVCWLGSRLAGALAYAHQQGVLHRDLKPANVLVAADGSPKLVDFNISFSSKLDGASPAAYFGGSLAYMSPEQLEACDPSHSRQADELDGRSDVYSLGVLLWELLTGARPFVDEVLSGKWSGTLAQMTARRRAGVTSQARARLPANCPKGLEAVLLKCLAPEAADRFASAADVARQLDLCLQPRAQQLLQSPGSTWRQLPRRWPVVTMVVLGLAPNIFMSTLSIAYNYYEIVRHLPEAVRRIFLDIQLLGVNVTAYTIGLVWFFLLAWSLCRTVSRPAAAADIDPAGLPLLRARCLTLGAFAARLSAGEWAVSGVVFPAWLQAQAGEAAGLTANEYYHFIASQVLCGLMAATLTFFSVTYVAVRVFYPKLMLSQEAEAEEANQLTALGRRISFYFRGAVAVPFIAVLPMVLIDTGKAAIFVLGIVGLAGSFLSNWLAETIRTDLAALASIINPSGQSLSGSTDLSDSFWTGSRR
jgi:hypothetical protein